MNAKSLFQKTVLMALVAALVVAAFPLTSAFAAPQADTPTPPPPFSGRQLSNERIENIWQRQLRGYERLGRLNDRSAELFDRADRLMAVLKTLGANTSELESALADFKAAVAEMQPVYASCKDIVDTHPGFDANGKVTNPAQAIQTIGDLGSKLRQIHDTLQGKGQTLIDLLKPILQALRPNRFPAPTPSTGVQ